MPVVVFQTNWKLLTNCTMDLKATGAQRYHASTSSGGAKKILAVLETKLQRHHRAGGGRQNLTISPARAGNVCLGKNRGAVRIAPETYWVWCQWDSAARMTVNNSCPGTVFRFRIKYPVVDGGPTTAA